MAVYSCNHTDIVLQIGTNLILINSNTSLKTWFNKNMVRMFIVNIRQLL